METKTKTKITKEDIQEVFGLLKEILDVSTDEILPELRKLQASKRKKGAEYTYMQKAKWNGLVWEFEPRSFNSIPKGTKTGKTKATRQKEQDKIKNDLLIKQKEDREKFNNKQSSGSEEY